jgi:iron complex outermembrane receptor protein
MLKNMINMLLTTTAVVAALPTAALAQATAPVGSDQAAGGLQEIVVTAQKREQNVQDVPIAVTALNSATLEVNRVSNVTDLSGLAPGVTVVTSAGGSQIPAFSIRGVTSYGVVPGSDKEVSIYLDGVYISSSHGSIFNLPDAQSIEVLRGPQGTLFGRNATAGAISITTRDPNGKLGAEADLTIGNYGQRRERITFNTPQVGPFSAYVTYLHDYKRGDIRNLAAGQVWDRSLAGMGKEISPQYLGTRDANSWFAALKFQPTDSFKMVYKFDHDEENDTPAGTALIALVPSYTAVPGEAALFASLANANNIPIDSSGKRPDAVSNSWAVQGHQTVTGHNLTATWEATDNVTIKNTLAYRKSYVFSAVPLDGLSGATLKDNGQSNVQNPLYAYAGFAAANAVPNFANYPAGVQSVITGQYYGGLQAAGYGGSEFLGVATNPVSTSNQWSDELQANYRSHALTLTGGLLWFHGNDFAGGPNGMVGTFQFVSVPASGLLPVGPYGHSLNKATSLAAYAQAEVHINSQLEAVLGARITKDDKSGSVDVGTGLNPPSTVIPFTYTKTKPNWLIGLNYKPDDNTLIYGKFSTAFVSGGSVAGIAFQPETAKSFEAGIKTELFDRHLRANLALYHVTYNNQQIAASATNFTAYLDALRPDIPNFAQTVGLFVEPIGGPVHAKGFEFDGTALLARGLTIGGDLAYNDTSRSNVNPILAAGNPAAVGINTEYVSALQPDWTGGVWGQFQSRRFAGGVRLVARVDANWHDKYSLTANPDTNGLPSYLNYAPSAWIVNGRVALTDIDFGGVSTELAVWAKNITQNRDINFPLDFGGAVSANFNAARTFGADLKLRF